MILLFIFVPFPEYSEYGDTGYRKVKVLSLRVVL